MPLPTSNRSLFREVNERIRGVNEAFRLRPRTYELVCECERCDCMQRLEVPGEVYETLRVDATRFLVAIGHEDDDRLVVGTDDYSVVARTSAAPETAAAAS